MSDSKAGNIPKTERIAQLPPPVAAVPVSPAAVSVPEPPSRDKLLDACHASVASVAASQRVVADEAAAMALELGAIARTTLSATGDGVTALFRARSLADMVEIQMALTRRNIDAFAAGSVRLGEIGLRLVAGGSKPFFDPPAAG